ncbi:hypothetical protein B0T17DRAFT_252072 [Bombardia bombarda]|uniref:Uncharacterized protein n=1 Tax=Bombardia bombarda TaxID=252184 RepID=A0AA40C4H9_9PEZI|nr:hypothetical protein B0T17DRAFT_252072 [Bombardia bombarda]
MDAPYTALGKDWRCFSQIALSLCAWRDAYTEWVNGASPGTLELHLECLCRCLGCRFWQPGPANFGTPKHPRQVHFWRGICTSRSPLHRHSTLSAHTAVAQLKRSLPAMRQDPDSGSQKRKARMAKKMYLGRPCRRVSCVGRHIRRDQLRDVIARVCPHQRRYRLCLGQQRCREITVVGPVSQWGAWTLLRLLESKRSLRRWKHRKPRRSPVRNFSITGIEETSDVLFDRDIPRTRR